MTCSIDEGPNGMADTGDDDILRSTEKRPRHDTREMMPEVLERRYHPRIHYPMPLKVQTGSLAFDTVVDDLSAGGIRSRTFREISRGQKIRFLVGFSTVGSHLQTMPKLSARGVVMRSRDLGDGAFEFAAKFTHFRFI